MDFDWGSFLGGSIGTLGAYLAARYTIKKQWEKERPKVERARYSTALSIAHSIDALSWKLINNIHISSNELMNKVIEFSHELDGLLPIAIEGGSELVNLIEDTKREISEFNREVWPHISSEERTSAEYVKRTIIILNNKMEVARSIANGIIDNRKAP
ncbi:hypothetical protein J4772_11400 [Cohnella sp. LGH]|uniref:hypothetical protein n=1 Tax=Cohnella sp. LGH TaxID=1619153 RepID=UPI001AD9F358|nr:hypothetical protein [Cohnella sp. LGH]QTH44946.1 hypothetical protein J4772_11400 [Cohnella sp. LGH]